MNTNMNTGESKLDRAEQAVSENIAKFETAMEHLTEKVEESSQKIQHVVDLGLRQKDELMHLKNRTEEALRPLMATGKNISMRVKENPRPFLWGAAAILGGLVVFSFMNRRNRSMSHLSEPYFDRFSA